MTEPPYSEIIASEQRRDILLLLMQSPPKFTATNRILHRALNSSKLFPPSQDQVDGHIAWMAQMGLVKKEVLEDGKTTAVTLVQRGKDAATGTADVPGIAPPEPEL